MATASYAANITPKEVPSNWTGVISVQDAQDLILGARRGDRAAFEALYRTYVPMVHRYVISRVDRSKVEDLVAEVFVRALKNITQYEFRGVEFSAWLLRIARNLILDQAKSAYANREVLHDAPPEVATVTETEATALASLEADTLRAAVRRMKPDHREVVELRFIRGLSCAETAKVMGKTEGAVRVLQFRALSALKKDLQKTAPELMAG